MKAGVKDNNKFEISELFRAGGGTRARAGDVRHLFLNLGEVLLRKELGIGRKKGRFHCDFGPLHPNAENVLQVPVRRLPRPSRSMHFSDVSETNGRKLARTTRPETHWPRLIMKPNTQYTGL